MGTNHRVHGIFPGIESALSAQLSNDLWDGVASLNTELIELMPVLFAPTSEKSEQVRLI